MSTVLNVLGSDVTVVKKPGVCEESDAYAMWSLRTSTITIDSDLAPTTEGEALVHEVIEAIVEKLELKLRHTQITAIGTAVHAFIRANPQTVKRLVDGVEVVK